VKTLLASLVLAWAAGPASAQILIGQTAGFTGAVAAGVKEITAGAKLYLDDVNAEGGIAGQKIELVSLDDAFEPKRAAENAEELIVRRKVLALFLTRGTPHTQAIQPLLAKYGVPLVAPSTGAMVLHKPVDPWLFNVRATYQREAERAVAHLATIGVRRIGVIHVDDSFGADLLEGAQRGLQAAGLEAAFVAKFDRSKPDFAPVLAAAGKAAPQAVLFIGSGSMVADGIAQLRKAGVTAQVVTFSNNASGGFVKSLGEHARGVIVAQVFPFERSMATAFVKEAAGLAKGKAELSPAMLEGFAAAKVLVAGLRRAPQPLTREGLRKALDDLGRLDLGGIELSYSPRDHTGLDFVDLSIIGAGGKFVR
jgi:ABC-type branched-subunit amino acid transport system substrate-binding protein